MIILSKHFLEVTFIQKKMISFAVLCVVSMVAINTVSSTKEEHKILQQKYNGASDVSDMFTRSRSKRAVVIPLGVFLAARYAKAAKAVKDLLSGATKVESDGLFSRQFEMKGDYLQAQKDFISLRPANVKPFELPGGIVGKEGKAGVMTIMVGNKDKVGKPYMKIYYGLPDIPRSRFDKIIYMD